MVHDMTVGSVRGHMVRMMLFVLAGLALQTLYSLVDIYFVGKLGKQAVAAVAVASNLMFVAVGVTQMLSVGCVALVAPAAGRKDHQEVQRLFNQAQGLSLFSGLVFYLVCFLIQHPYARHLAGDAKTAELTLVFMTCFLPSLGLQFAMVGLVSALRGIGNMKPGLLAQSGSVLLNMILAPMLIFGWPFGHPFGLFGAALATLIATAAAVIGLLLYLRRKETYLRLSLSALRPDFATWRTMVAVGLPAGVEFLLLALNMSIVYLTIRSFGSEAQAGFGIGSRLLQVCWLPAVAISYAIAAVVGQNYGAQRWARIRETYWEGAKITLVVMLLFTALCAFVPEPLVTAFSADPRVIEVGADYLHISAYNFAASGMVFVVAGIFQGLGNTWPSLVASATRSTLFIVPVLWFGRQLGFQIETIWWTGIFATSVQLALCLWLVRRELELKVPFAPELSVSQST